MTREGKKRVRVNIDLDVYESRIHETVQQYLETELSDPGDIVGNSSLFAGLMKYIYKRVFKPGVNDLVYNNTNSNLDLSDIDKINNIWDIYTSLCYKYKKRPTLLNFSLMTGIDNNTIHTWINGTARSGADEMGNLHMRTAKKWKAECESILVDGAVENNSIGCIFALKANYGYTETPQQLIVTGAGTPQLTADDLARLRESREPAALPEKPVIDLE